MKKSLGSFVVGSLFFFGSIIVFAGTVSSGGTMDIPAGGACGATSDCAAGLICRNNNEICITPPSTAATRGGGTPFSVDVPQIANPIKYDTFSAFVAAVLKIAVEILMPFVVLAFIWSGFLFVKAQGKPEELETAKKAIYWSIIGAFILMGAYGFAQIIGTTVSSLTQ